MLVRRVLAFVTAVLRGIFAWHVDQPVSGQSSPAAKKAFRTANVVFGGLFGAVRGGLRGDARVPVGGCDVVSQRDWWREALLSPYFERTGFAASIPRQIPRVPRHIRSGYRLLFIDRHICNEVSNVDIMERNLRDALCRINKKIIL